MAFSSRLPAMSLDDAKRVALEAHPALSASRQAAPSPRAGDPFGGPHPLGMMSATSGRRSNGSGPASPCARRPPGDHGGDSPRFDRGTDQRPRRAVHRRHRPAAQRVRRRADDRRGPRRARRAPGAPAGGRRARPARARGCTCARHADPLGTHPLKLAASSAAARPEPGALSAWVGVVILAGILLVLVGALHAVAGVSTLAGAQLDVLAPQPGGVADPVWGLLCVAVGTLEVFTGYGVFRGAMWARVIAVAVGLSGVVLSAAYSDLPAYAVSLLAMVGAVVVYAVLAHGTEVRPLD